MAEDVVHATFVAVAQQKSEVKDLRAYLFRSVRNAAFNQLAAAKRNQSWEGVPLQSFLVAARENNPDLSYLNNERLEQVDRAMEQISFEQKEAIVLKIYAGLKFREIAKLLDEPMATITSRYRRGLAALADELREYFDEN